MATAVQKLDENHKLIVEAEFRNKDLTYETSQSILLYLESITALDLSYNKIERFPQLLPASLTALNLSHNALSFIKIAPGNLKNLVELNLSFNNLERYRYSAS
jgi:Leucine-rich repeat (LRR) protein